MILIEERLYADSAKGLKPCPTCASESVGWIDASYSFQFVCNGCGHPGPNDDGWGIEEARKRWDNQ